jgi:CheY-like chemotaxis protein
MQGDSPAPTQSSKVFATPPSSGDALAAGQLILLVEDNLINQKVATIILNRLGYAVHVVANGLMAVEAVKTLPYALVLMDCQMPVMDGFEATQTIRRGERGTGHIIPIIAMTANAMQGDRERCLEAGMNDYLTKPIDQNALFNVLQRWMPERKRSMKATSPVRPE